MTVKKNQRGMTLIEILLALVVMVVGIVGILALFPPALESAKESMEETQAAILSDSIAQSISQAIRFATWDSENSRWNVVLTHDLRDDANVVKYVFPNGLPTLKQGWQHHPGDEETASRPQEQSVFLLAGDEWVAAEHNLIRETNDASDPYNQFSFSLDVKKINTLEYMIENKKFMNEETGEPYKLEDLEPLVKLYEFRIHIFRVWSEDPELDLQEALSQGHLGKKLISTITSRMSTR